MQLSGARMVVEAIKAEGIGIIFGYPGGQALPGCVRTPEA